jgi:DNA-binding MarR family transcriptional regulator
MENITLDLEVIFAILSGKVSLAINRHLHRQFRQAGLDITPEQWSILLCLWNKDGVTQQDLCNATFKDKPSMTRLIDNLEKRYLVVRIPNKKDKRINMIHLTKKGKEIRSIVGPITIATMEKAIYGLTNDEIKMSEILFLKVFNNLEK